MIPLKIRDAKGPVVLKVMNRMRRAFAYIRSASSDKGALTSSPVAGSTVPLL